MATWTVATPTSPVTLAHVVLRPVTERAEWSRAGAADLAAAYRDARAALGSVFECDGFTVVFALNWRPSGAGIGEPTSEHAGSVHVFGRYEGEPLKPSAAMSVAVDDRPAVLGDGQLRTALAASSSQQPTIPAPTVREGGCDGCIPSVRDEQERWRCAGVRVIRPMRSLIGPHSLVLPLRHVVSIGDLSPEEILSIRSRLIEVRKQFAEGYGSTGASCFVNDGRRAGQETPHVHLHVFGRAVDEAEHPFERLRDLLIARPAR